MSEEFPPDAVVVGQCLSPVEYRTRKELAELAFECADNQAVHRVKIALLDLIKNHQIYRQYTNEPDNVIPIGWSFKFSQEGYHRFRTSARPDPTRAEFA